jgi:hypothetical protein
LTSLPENEVSKPHFQDDVSASELDLTACFGNSGQFTLVFPDNFLGNKPRSGVIPWEMLGMQRSIIYSWKPSLHTLPACHRRNSISIFAEVLEAFQKHSVVIESS